MSSCVFLCASVKVHRMETRRIPKTRRSRPHIPGQVLSQLRTYIIEQGLKPGDRMPTERQLAMDLKVSRNSVREALTSLEAVGAVSRRPKIGCVLQPIDMAMLAEVTQFQMLRDENDRQELFIARIMLEESILPLAVANATEEDFQRMEQAIIDMEKNIADPGLVTDADEAFHRALFAAAHNKFLFQFGSLVQVFFRELRTLVRSAQGPDTKMQVLKEHRAILDAIRKRDLASAQRHLRHHLGAYRRQGLVTLDAGIFQESAQ